MLKIKYNLIINNKTSIRKIILNNKIIYDTKYKKRHSLNYKVDQPLVLFLQNTKKILKNQNKTFIFLYLQLINQNLSLLKKIPKHSIKFAKSRKNLSSFTQRIDIQTQSSFLKKLIQNLNFNQNHVNIFEVLIRQL